MTIFIGENDSGKSCILRALECFFRDKLPDIEIIHKINDQRENKCAIILRFKPNGNEEIPKDIIINKNVTIRKEYLLDESGAISSKLTIERYLYKDDQLNSIPVLKAQQLKDLCAKYSLDYVGVENAKEMLSNYIQENFETLDKTVDCRDVKWSDISPMMPLFEHYDSSNYVNPRKIIETTLQSIYRSFFYDYDKDKNESLKSELAEKMEEIKKELDKRIEDSLKEKVASKNNKIKNISGEYTIEFSAGFTLSDILIDYGPGSHSLDGIGEGSKKRLFLAIMEWDKEIRAKEPHKMILRGYDEPDSSLHYGAQKEMYYTLRDLSNNIPSQVQVIICTHSISMIDRAPARVINHIIQNDGVSTIDRLKGDTDEEVKKFLDNVSEISGIKNSSLFFERCFVIVEGETEYNALPEIYEKLTSRKLYEDGVVLINLKGNSSWKPFLKLLNKNKSKATILFLDKDIQQCNDRIITSDSLAQIGFGEDFLTNNVIFAGIKEFEDLFPDELICKCLDSYWPKKEGENWLPDGIKLLRKEKKFSEEVIKKVRKYRHENFGRDANLPNKPEFGKKIAEIATVDEIKKIADLVDLINKIKCIID